MDILSRRINWSKLCIVRKIARRRRNEGFVGDRVNNREFMIISLI
jgi:hypothetical protein